MASTAQKRQIISYLWEWAEKRGRWATKLVSEIIDGEQNLSPESREVIYKIFLESLSSDEKVDVKTIAAPQTVDVSTNLSLLRLHSVTGVNRLAKEQTLDFAKNVTVVYGDNATGKSGYGRILRSLGQCYEPEKTVHSNAYSNESESKSATVEYETDGKEKSFIWNGENFCDQLQSLSLFNNNCVAITLGNERELLVKPVGFHLFDLLSQELTELGNIHKQNIEDCITAIAWASQLHQDTDEQKLISNLNHSTDPEKLLSKCCFSDDDDVKLGEYREKLKELSKTVLEERRAKLRGQFTELKELTSTLRSDISFLKESHWEILQKDARKIKELSQKKKASLSEVASERNIEFFDSPKFQTFIKAADNYLKLLSKENYPSDADPCIYCRQPLSSVDSRQLIQSYKEILNDTSQAELSSLQKDHREKLKKFKLLKEEYRIHKTTFGSDEEGNATQPKELEQFNSELKRLIQAVTTEDLGSITSTEFRLALDPLIVTLETKKEEIQTSEEQLSKDIKNIETKEKELKNKINSLENRKLLNSKKDELVKVLDTHKERKVLEANQSKFNTISVSKKTSEARKAIIGDSFQTIFQEEIKKLKRGYLPIKLDLETEKGKSRISQNISNKYKLSEILSEGEQKAIALAEFITELQLDSSSAPVIFDDPVSSLDHKIIDDVAKRLVNLSSDRQVVVFTHSVILLNSILSYSKKPRCKNLEFKYYSTGKSLEHTGILNEGEVNLPDESFKAYRTKINKILNSSKEEKNRRGKELAKEGYSNLRAGIEVLVEKNMFQGVVKRYAKNIALSNLEKIDPSLIQKHQITLSDVFDRACGFILGHSNADEVVNEPTLEELKIDLGLVDSIYKDFGN